MPLFSKVLIANRGEIAVRIAKACAAMGIKSVGVYSEADRNALHTRVCDEAFHIGGAPASESYLRADRILEVAKEAGCDAVHPGFGFLAENAQFAEAVIGAELAWVGPPPSAISLMGSKIESKRLAQAHGVPIVPGYFGDDQSLATLHAQALEIGFPLLIKASAGGGGKGMRVVTADSELESAFDAARRESLAAFGDESVMLERYLERPRHIEIQVMGDKHGAMLHLGERECSIQRRHQKVAEESPSPAMTPLLRDRMTSAALSLAKAAGYENAGTMEFIFQDGDFFFLEMNTRLQVEHPVTEEALGVDIVQMQLRVAAGEHLPLTQSEVRFKAHALEVRLYAEDPERGFLPSTGDLKKLRLPYNIEGVRVDAGVAQGDTVSPYYDPMIAKIVTWGPDRDASIAKMQEALGYTEVGGVQTNLSFLRWLVAHPRFIYGDISTRFIDEEFKPGLQAAIPNEAIIIGALVYQMEGSTSQDIWHRQPWRQLRQDIPLNLLVNGQQYSVRLTQDLGSNEEWHAKIMSADEILYQDTVSLLTNEQPSTGELRAVSFSLGQSGNLRRTTIGPLREGSLFAISVDDRKYWVKPASALSTETLITAVHLSDEDSLESPMPGKVLRVLAAAGDNIAVGQPLVIIEAMKMEFTVKAPHSGAVEEVYYKVGDQVAVGDVLVKLGKHST